MTTIFEASSSDYKTHQEITHQTWLEKTIQ